MFARKNAPAALVLVAAFMVASSSLAPPAEALFAGLACLKDSILNRLTNSLLANNPLVSEYKEAVDMAAARFLEAKDAEPVKSMDDKEQENYFLRLVADEINDLKARMKKGEVEQAAAGADVVDEKTKECLDGDAVDEESFNTDAWYDWNPDELAEKDEEDNEKLFSQLESIEEEMGFALDAATKAKLKLRTKTVLTDILNNEARQIAMSILTAYMTGGIGSTAAYLTPFLGALRVKLIQYLINAVVDVVSQAMNVKIELQPAESLPVATKA